jgi:hypothetical protein
LPAVTPTAVSAEAAGATTSAALPIAAAIVIVDAERRSLRNGRPI